MYILEASAGFAICVLYHVYMECNVYYIHTAHIAHIVCMAAA